MRRRLTPAARLRCVTLAVGLVTAAWAIPMIGVDATYGARTTADEPQYLLTALSLGEDGSLDISDERAAGRYRPFHEAGLPLQERVRADDSRVSPHDPLLPLLLALPMRAGGWVAAKATLALLAGALAAALVWVAVRRLAVAVRTAALTVLAFSLAAPLAVYGTQVYPELPAALGVTVAIGALTGPLRRGGVLALSLAVVALPWLAVKYIPVAGALALVGVVRLWRRGDHRSAAILAAGLAAGVVVYLAAHRALYDGWTVYASGDHFAGGELTVAGTGPDLGGRAHRLLGLLVDRGFGLAAWQPAFLLAVPALAALARARPRGWVALVLPLAAGWLVATFAALTMHGWWWPGRQVVVVLPCVVLAVAWWAGRARPARVLVVVGGMAGVVVLGWLVVEGLAGRLTLIVDFEATADPLYRAWRLVLPDGRRLPVGTDVLRALWYGIVALLAWWGWRTAGSPSDPTPDTVPGATRREALSCAPVPS